MPTEIRFSDEELHSVLKPFLPLVGRFLRHVRTGGLYVIEDVHFRESDMKIEVTYRKPMKNAPAFARPIEEILDTDRFTVGHPQFEVDEEIEPEDPTTYSYTK